MDSWLSLARRLTSKSRHAKQRMAAVIVRGGRVLAHAVNDPRWGRHAELRAIQQVIDLRGATIYIARCSGHRVAKPCATCASAIRSAGIRTVVYTTVDGYLVEEI